MNSMSFSKVGGLCLCIGAVLTTVPFLFQITLGGTPEEGALIWRYFSDEITKGGNLSLLYPILSLLGISFLIFGTYTLNCLLQKQKEDGLLSLGTVLIILGSIGYMFVWSLDYHILWGQHIENAWQIASLGMTMEICMVMLFGIVNWSGVQCFAAALSMRGYGKSTLVKITSGFAGLHVVIHFYTIFNLDPMSASSIMPFFIGMTLGQFVLLAFNISLGMKMMKD